MRRQGSPISISMGVFDFLFGATDTGNLLLSLSVALAMIEELSWQS